MKNIITDSGYFSKRVTSIRLYQIYGVIISVGLCLLLFLSLFNDVLTTLQVTQHDMVAWIRNNEVGWRLHLRSNRANHSSGTFGLL